MSSAPEEIIIRSLQKTATEEEIQILNDWLREDKQHIELYCQLEEIWNSRNQLTDATIQDGWNRLCKDITARPPKDKSGSLYKRQTRFLWMRYIAAVFVGIVIASTAWVGFQSKEVTIEKELLVQNKIYNQNGVQAVLLPDHSQVWLNENSTISYPEQFKEKERLVSLTGKAYFDIRKNIAKPFIVRTGDIEVKVTGTEFFVESTAENNALITLISGGVDIQYRNESGKSISASLTPGQQADINKLNGEIHITDVETHYYTVWKDGTYCFTDEPLENIVLLLARHYNLSIQVDPSLQKKRFTGRVTSGDNISDVMEVINTSYPVKYRITGNTVKISDL